MACYFVLLIIAFSFKVGGGGGEEEGRIRQFPVHAVKLVTMRGLSPPLCCSKLVFLVV